MRSFRTSTEIARRALLATGIFCLWTGGLAAAESGNGTLLFASESLGLAAVSQNVAADDRGSFPLMLGQESNLVFDLAGSEQRKLQLLLDQPLSLNAGMSARSFGSGSDILGLDATLNLPLNDTFGLSAGIDRQVGASRFHSLGSIQCHNGTLRADSYTASGCRFVNEPLAVTERNRMDLGARFDFADATASLSWFTQESTLDQRGARQSNLLGGGQAMMTSGFLSPMLVNPLLAPNIGDPLQYMNAEASGVDLNFKVGIATDTHGDVRLGLAFSRVLEADYAGHYLSGPEALSWTLAEPFNSARMDLEWSKGAFSTGIQGYYRDSVDFLNRDSVDGLTTFDVHFTWRTPWNANLSVGATNVLGAGSDTATSAENPPVDPLESIYGRIPYVRYKQDL
jgi:hypothetical protein